jgi:hypothetical protein
VALARYNASGLRPAFPLLALALYAPAAFGQDARVAYLSKQLKSGTDVRLKAQSAVLLGNTGSPQAVEPLCSALRDADSLVRNAAANALGELGQQGGVACLKAALSDADASVKAAVKRSIDRLSVPPVPTGSLYFSIDVVKSDVGDDAKKLAEQLFRQKLTDIGGVIAPEGETKAAATALVKAKKLRGYLLRPALTPEGSKGLKLEVLVMTYPDLALRGSFNVKAKGGAKEKLLKLMVPRVIDDAADELQWKEPQ